jgi:NAD(P)-dependent dehydrogenase (short-subunit alcohol dehydrogenase family)
MATFDRSVAVVTGAASGIGQAIAERFVAEGAYVVAADLNDACLESREGRWQAVKCDVSNEGDLEGAFRAADEAGMFSVLVNCAGISAKVPIDAISAEQWQHVIDVNLTGSALAIKHAVPVMKRNGGGAIVNIASIAAFTTASVHNTVYAATKGAIVSLTRALVYELSPFNIRINALAPGIVNTPILQGHPPEWFAERAGRIPLGRLGSVSEMADVVMFLASDASSYITGQTIVADGGITSVMYSTDAQR